MAATGAAPSLKWIFVTGLDAMDPPTDDLAQIGAALGELLAAARYGLFVLGASPVDVACGRAYAARSAALGIPPSVAEIFRVRDELDEDEVELPADEMARQGLATVPGASGILLSATSDHLTELTWVQAGLDHCDAAVLFSNSLLYRVDRPSLEETIIERCRKRGKPIFPVLQDPSLLDVVLKQLIGGLHRGYGVVAWSDLEALCPGGGEVSEWWSAEDWAPVLPKVVGLIGRALVPPAAVVPVRIIVFCADPASTPRLALDEEVRAITVKIRDSKYRDALELLPELAARPDDLLQALNEHQPSVVQFSGHGTATDEIVLVGDDGQPRPVGVDALTALFATLKGRIRLVLFSACYTRDEAQAVAANIECVIGMSRQIGDEAARTFTSAFYRAVGFGQSVRDAFDQAVVALKLVGSPDATVPLLFTRPGVDASSVVLVTQAPPTSENSGSGS